MKLISYDVGIKNMAYVIFDIQHDSLSMCDWNVINLMQATEIPQKTCVFEIVKKKTLLESSPNICGNKANYEKNGLCFCTMHAKKMAKSKNYLFPETSKISEIRKHSLDKLHTLGISYGIFLETGCPKTKKESLEKVISYVQQNSMQKIDQKREKAGEVDLITLGRSLKHELDGLNHLEGLTHIIIENQISPIATRMKTLQGMLAQYYIMKDENGDFTLEFISSSNKLKHLVKKQGQENNYKQHKIDSIHFCKEFLEANSGLSMWKSSLETRKKDDLADCFLQAIYYLKTQKLITYAEDLKINSISLS
tara:strand:- start:6609 stop:7532 length:924 start_codon:yes stop_codon:yes gene_type:complete